MRSGTVPTHLCVGLGAACSLAQQEIRFTFHFILTDIIRCFNSNHVTNLKV